MKIISDFKYIDNNRIKMLTTLGDVVVAGSLKYIRVMGGYVSELGTTVINIRHSDHIIVIKREKGDSLEDLLLEGEKRCRYDL